MARSHHSVKRAAIDGLRRVEQSIGGGVSTKTSTSSKMLSHHLHLAPSPGRGPLGRLKSTKSGPEWPRLGSDKKPSHGIVKSQSSSLRQERGKAKATPVVAANALSLNNQSTLPEYTVGGSVYPVKTASPLAYSNADGMRVNDGRYTKFQKDIAQIVPEERIYTDPVKTFAYGTDASFYRLLPQVVVKIHNEKEVQKILPIAAENETPVTFRAAGTSLSGQAVSDSILLKLSHTGKNFRNYEIKRDGI
jgi:hypothetical protein